MEKRPVKKTLIQYAIVILFLLSIISMLTGCSDLVEVQDRDFVLALGVSLENGKYELTFALPDLSTLTNEEKADGNTEGYGQIRTYESISLSEMEDLYNHGSNKRLDYSHLEALILDASISSSADKMPALLEYMESNYQISRDVRVFYFSGDARELIETKGKISGSIGDYLKNLEENNQRKNGLPSVTIGNLMDSLSQGKTLVVPLLEIRGDMLEVKGAAIFQDAVYVKEFMEEELNVYYVIKGYGKEFNFYTQNDLVFKLKELKSKTKYLYQNGKPTIQLTITGKAEVLSGSGNDDMDIDTETSEYLKNAIVNQITTCFKEDKIDYINLYDGSSIKSRDIWLDYQDRRDDFINDVVIDVNVIISTL